MRPADKKCPPLNLDYKDFKTLQVEITLIELVHRFILFCTNGKSSSRWLATRPSKICHKIYKL